MNKAFEKILERLETADSVKVFGSLNSGNRLIPVQDAKQIVQEVAEEYNGGWIPVEEQLPKDGDNRYYMCIVENHEEDPPMYCQYDEECGFGFYQDIYDEHTLGFVDCVFQTNEELGYEKVIAWQQLLPYQPNGGKVNRELIRNLIYQLKEYL